MEGYRELQIDSDREYHSLLWKIKRFGWGLIALLLIAAFLGVFGTGILANHTAGSRDNLFVEYQRFGRYQSPAHWKIHVAAGNTNILELSFNREAIDKVEIEAIVPEPESVSLKGSELVYAFKRESPELPTLVVFSFQANAFGRLEVIAKSKERPGETRFKQFFYP